MFTNSIRREKRRVRANPMAVCTVGLLLTLLFSGCGLGEGASQQSPQTAAPSPQAIATATPEATPRPTVETNRQTAGSPRTTTPEPTAEAIVIEPATVTPQTEAPLKSIPTGQIAFIDSNSRLGIVAPDGSSRRLLSGADRSYQFPVWSPVSPLLAVIGNDATGGGVYITTGQPDSEVQRLYVDQEERPIYLYWSPDGQNVSFIARHRQGIALHLLPIDDADARQVLTVGQRSFFWNWLPDSQQLLIHTGFTGRVEDVSRLAFLSVNDELEETEIPQAGFFQAPAVAADGRYYAFGETDVAGNHWLNVWDAENDRQSRLVFHQGVTAMGWSPTASQLAYISPGAPRLSFYGPLRLLDLDSGDSLLLVEENVFAFFWSPDGRFIAYLTLAEDGGGPRAQTPPNHAKTPHRAKQGGRAFLQQESRIRLNLWVVEVESGRQRLLTTFAPSSLMLDQFLPFFDQYAVSHHIWAPDSSAIVLAEIDGSGGEQIIVVPVSGEKPTVIAEGGIAFWNQQ